MMKLAIGTESLNRTPMAVSVYGGGSSVVERGFCKPMVESSIPSRRPNFSAPLAALTAHGAYLRLTPKAGLGPTVILSVCLKESKAQNDRSESTKPAVVWRVSALIR